MLKLEYESKIIKNYQWLKKFLAASWMDGMFAAKNIFHTGFGLPNNSSHDQLVTGNWPKGYTHEAIDMTLSS